MNSPLIQLEDVYKSFGSTKALSGLSLEIRPGELVGIIGHNGAGKSTTMRTIVGLHRPDKGRVILRGEDVTDRFTSKVALQRGIRAVYQELELPGSLRVREAAIFAAQSAVGGARGWRSRAERCVLDLLDQIFPGSQILADQRIEDLSIAQRQMISIALAGLWPGGHEATCLVLDEPTSSLDAPSAKSLYAWLRQQARESSIGILISTHKLNEVLGELDRAYVLVEGKVTTEMSMADATRDALVSAMRQEVAGKPLDAAVRAEHAVAGELVGQRTGGVKIYGLRSAALSIDELSIESGEIVGLGGLEGQGQKDLLRVVYSCASGSGKSEAVAISGTAAFVSGDRAEFGVFPLWSVEHNLSISSISRLAKFGLVSRQAEQKLTSDWHSSLAIKGQPGASITSLSGGNQQKVLVGRALAVSPDLLLLDDPTRGVDEETKLEIFALIRAQSRRGTAVIWYSTETMELYRCDRVIVMSGGKMSGSIETRGEEVAAFEDKVLGASFSH